MNKSIIAVVLSFLFIISPSFADRYISLSTGSIKENCIARYNRELEYLPDGIHITYSFDGVNTYLQSNKDCNAHWRINGFASYMTPGYPDLPVIVDKFYIPLCFDVSLEIEKSPYFDINTTMTTTPFSEENYVSSSMDNNISYDGFFPRATVTQENEQIFREHRIINLQISPLLYCTKEQRLRCHSKVSFTLRYKKCLTINASFSDTPKISDIKNHPIALLSTPIINPTEQQNNIYDDDILPASLLDKNMLILCPKSLVSAANKLAAWKRALGYRVTITSNLLWSTTKISDEIRNEYRNNLHLRYVLFLGNSSLLPSNSRTFIQRYLSKEDGSFILRENEYPYASDRPYVCLDGPNDTIPEFYYGRIPVSSLEEANNVVDKIISYEKGINSSPSYYNNFLLFSHLQDNKKGEELTRCTRTAEEINNYLCDYLHKSTTRFYIRDNDTIRWWNPIYYKRDSIPDSLINADIWNNTSSSKINAAINNGLSVVFYSGHGDIDRYKYFNYTIDDLHQLSNHFYPVFFNTTCLTGAFHVDKNTGKPISSFSTELLKMKDAGASAVIASSTVTSVGSADALKLGLFHAIWPHNILTPTINNGTPSEHYYNKLENCRLGEILEYSKECMSYWYADNDIFNQHKNDTAETFYVVGDPSMEFYKEPQKVMRSIAMERSGSTITVDASLVYNPDIHIVNEKTGERKSFFATNKINVQVENPDDYTIGITAKGYFPTVYFATE